MSKYFAIFFLGCALLFGVFVVYNSTYAAPEISRPADGSVSPGPTMCTDLPDYLRQMGEIMTANMTMFDRLNPDRREYIPEMQEELYDAFWKGYQTILKRFCPMVDSSEYEDLEDYYDAYWGIE